VEPEYQVLARKWRPQVFEDVAGQEHVVRTLRNAVAQGRVAHAYLFCGPRGVGKTTAARLLARALNCEKGPTPDPCGTCSACIEITAGTSVDVAEIDGASNNGVDDVRAIRENARYLPSRDRNKIYIIDEVHMLSQQAFNALLKTLEEPPPHVKFIFATTEVHKLPDTITSRCQVHNFRRIPLTALMARLKAISDREGFGLSDEALSLVARQAEGSMRDALSLLDQVVMSCGTDPSLELVAAAVGSVDRRVVLALAAALCDRDAAAVVRILGEQIERGAEPNRICEALCEELRNLIVARLTGAPPAGLPDHEQQLIAATARGADPAHLARLFDLAHTALGELGQAFEPRLALEVALLKGVFLAPGAAISDLLARVEALSGRLPEKSGEGPGERGEGSSAAREPAATGARSPLPSPPRGERGLAPQAAKGIAPIPPAATAPDLGGGDPLSALIAAALVQSPRLGTALKHGRLRTIRPGEVALAYPKADFRAAQLRGERPAIEALLSVHFGVPTSLRLVEAEPTDPPSIAEQEAAASAERKEGLRSSALGSQAVQDALRIFGGEVEDVRSAEPPPTKAVPQAPRT
jgi:DNA polymerase-3 subunit gamma/tau